MNFPPTFLKQQLKKVECYFTFLNEKQKTPTKQKDPHLNYNNKKPNPKTKALPINQSEEW